MENKEGDAYSDERSIVNLTGRLDEVFDSLHDLCKAKGASFDEEQKGKIFGLADEYGLEKKATGKYPVEAKTLTSVLVRLVLEDLIKSIP